VFIESDDEGYNTTEGVTSKKIIETPWISLMGLQGYQRIYRALFMFQWKGGLIKIHSSYDYYEGSNSFEGFGYEDVATWDHSDLSAIAQGDFVQIEYVLPEQKLQSVRFLIYSNDNNSFPSTRNSTLLGMTLEIGRKPGLAKLGSGHVK
jgi:hypothetical protein